MESIKRGEIVRKLKVCEKWSEKKAIEGGVGCDHGTRSMYHTKRRSSMSAVGTCRGEREEKTASAACAYAYARARRMQEKAERIRERASIGETREEKREEAWQTAYRART